MTNFKPNNRTLNALQRWTASGLAKPAPLMERLAMLDEIMLRNDLNGTEKTLCWYLIYKRSNAENGLCFASDRNIADALNINIRTVERTKQSLKEKGIIDWNTERLNRKNTVSLFRFYIQRTTGHQTGIKPDNETGTKRNNTDRMTGINSDNVTGTYYAKFGSAELAAWDQWNQITKGKSLPRDRAGGWNVATQWPPKIQMTLEDLLAT